MKERWRNNAADAVKILDPRAEFLRGRDYNITSQGGEDGLIAALFERIGTRNKWCFEVGAHDGEYLSNTWALRKAGWTAVLIEADEGHYAKLESSNPGRAWMVHQRIKPDSLDYILLYAEAPDYLDLGVIDIDGEDVHIWDGLKRFRPRVILIEYNTSGEDGFLGGYHPPVWQAGPETVLKMGKRKGYRPLAKTMCNLLFVDASEITA